MRRSFFSPSSSSSNGSTITSSAAPQERSKRRSFAFLKYSPKHKPTVGSMRRTREHSKQIVSALSKEGDDDQSDQRDTIMNFPLPTNNFSSSSSSMLSPHYHQQQQQQLEETSASPTVSEGDSASVRSSSSFAFEVDHFPSPSQAQQIMSTPRQLHLQQQQQQRPAADAAPSSSNRQRLSPSNHTSSISKSSPANKTKKRSTSTSRKVMKVKQQPSPAQSSAQYDSSRTLPTFPSNSTMLAKNISSNSLGASSSTNAGAVKRRMQRRQQQQQQHSELDRDTVSGSPLSFQRSGSNNSSNGSGSFRSLGSASANKVQNYLPSSSFHATAATAQPPSPQHQSQDYGFSFDAFGLDEKQVDQEVTAAIEGLTHDFFMENEFAVQSFDSPAHSRTSSPPRFDFDVVVDNDVDDTSLGGFRVRSQMPSPTVSDRSSLTNSTEAGKEPQGRTNMFKEQAGFAKSRTRLPPSHHEWAQFDDDAFATGPSSIPALLDGKEIIDFPMSAAAATNSNSNFNYSSDSHTDLGFGDSNPMMMTDDGFMSSDAVITNSEKQQQQQNFMGDHVDFFNQVPDEVFGKTETKLSSPFPSASSPLEEKREDQWEIVQPRGSPRRLRIGKSFRGNNHNSNHHNDVVVDDDDDEWGRDMTPEPERHPSEAGSFTPDSSFMTPERLSAIGMTSDVDRDWNTGMSLSMMTPPRKQQQPPSKEQQQQQQPKQQQESSFGEPEQMQTLEPKLRYRQKQGSQERQPQHHQQAVIDQPEAERNTAPPRFRYQQKQDRPGGRTFRKPPSLTISQDNNNSVNQLGLRSVPSLESPDGPTPQHQRATECATQRTSIASHKERLKSHESPRPAYIQTEIDVGRQSSGEYKSVMDRVRGMGLTDSRTSSDVGATTKSAPEFLSSVKLKKTMIPTASPTRAKQQENEQPKQRWSDGTPQQDDLVQPEQIFHQPQQRTLTYREKRELEIQRQQAELGRRLKVANSEDEGEREEKAQPKKLTYRERREQELKAQQQAKEQEEAKEKANKPQERDVAALIRKRIAANKKTSVQTNRQSVGTGEDISNLRNRLKKVSIESKITQFRAPTVKAPSPQPQPEFLVKGLKKVALVDTAESSQSNQHMNSPVYVRRAQEVNEEEERRSPEMDLYQNPYPSQRGLAEEAPVTPKRDSPMHNSIAALSGTILAKAATMVNTRSSPETPVPEVVASTSTDEQSISGNQDDTKNKLNAFFANRIAGGPITPSQKKKKTDTETKEPAAAPSNILLSAGSAVAALMKSRAQKMGPKSLPSSAPPATEEEEKEEQPESKDVTSQPAPSDGRPALKNDPKYERYFRMLKVGMPLEVVKHAMTQDGVDASVMDGDHDKPAGFGEGVPLKEDPVYSKYFKMLKIGLPMGAVKNAMERDGLDGSVMDGDHNLPANMNAKGSESRGEKKPKDTHRRSRLHWDTLRKVRQNSLWAKLDQDEEIEKLEIDEKEFQELFQAELTPADSSKARNTTMKKGAAVRVIDAKRANNGGIILARLKMTHDEMADAVDRIDENALTSEQMQNIIEYLPTSDERKALEAYMLSGGIDAAEKFEGLCECEKFMVAMMTVKHAKRKVQALLFKLQYGGCLDSLQQDTSVVEAACVELSNSVRLRKLLGIVLNIGNRLNTAGVSSKRKAGAFKLESLLKLSQAKAFDKKTTFLHYIVLVVQRNNELLLGFKDDIPTVMKADRVYWDQCVNDLEEVENQLENVRRIALHQARLVSRHRLRKKKKKKPQGDDDDENSLSDSSMPLEEEVGALRSTEIGVFTLGAIKKVSALRDNVENTKKKFVKLLEYFGEDEKSEMQPHELFNIMCTFCRDFDKAKDQVLKNIKKKNREDKKNNTNKPTASQSKPEQATPKPIKAKPATMLRASNMQPSMSAVLKTSYRKPPTPKTSQNVRPQKSQTQQNGRYPQQNGFHKEMPGKRSSNSKHSHQEKEVRHPQQTPSNDDVASPHGEMLHKSEIGKSSHPQYVQPTHRGRSRSGEMDEMDEPFDVQSESGSAAANSNVFKPKGSEHQDLAQQRPPAERQGTPPIEKRQSAVEKRHANDETTQKTGRSRLHARNARHARMSPKYRSSSPRVQVQSSPVNEALHRPRPQSVPVKQDRAQQLPPLNGYHKQSPTAARSPNGFHHTQSPVAGSPKPQIESDSSFPPPHRASLNPSAAAQASLREKARSRRNRMSSRSTVSTASSVTSASVASTADSDPTISSQSSSHGPTGGAGHPPLNAGPHQLSPKSSIRAKRRHRLQNIQTQASDWAEF